MTAPLDAELAELAERLRRVTVGLRIGGAGEGSGVIWQSDGLVVTGHPSTPGYNDPQYPIEGRVPRSG